LTEAAAAAEALRKVENHTKPVFHTMVFFIGASNPFDTTNKHRRRRQKTAGSLGAKEVRG
jgi:hypothetical protein